MKVYIPYLVAVVALSGCSSTGKTTLEGAQRAQSSQWNWETHGAAKTFSWYRPTVAVALPQNIAQATLTPATLEEVSAADEELQRQFGAHWEPLRRIRRDGDTLWRWKDKSGKGGFLIKSADGIKAWRFVHYGPP